MINIACNETHSVNEIFDTINGLFGGKVKRHDAPGRLGDPMKSHADINKAINILGYKPLVNFEAGILETVNWWKEGCPI